MALAYRPPGVSVQEITSPTVSPLLATPASVGIVGLTQGYIERTDQIKLSGTTAHSLVTEGNLPSDATLTQIVAVKDPFDPGHAPNADGTYRGPSGGTTGSASDYDVSLTGKSLTRHAPNTPSAGDGLIPDGRIVAVTYRYVSADYWNAILLEDLGSVQARFGPAWANGAIASDLTYAAAVAFENGARFVVCQPLFARATPGNPDTAAQAPVVGGVNGDPDDNGSFANPSTWADTFYALRDIEDVNVFVPVIGQSATRKITNSNWLSIAQTCQDHLAFLAGQDQFGVMLIGEDGTTTSAVSGEFPTKASIRNDASTLAARYGAAFAQSTVLVNGSRFVRPRPDSSASTLTVGGQYMAAALAGMLASRSVSSPLTRKQVSGFTGVTDYRSLQDKNDDAASGLLVVEQKGLATVVRHAVTTDTSAAHKRELSVVRGKQYMIESLRETLDSQVIGVLIADANAPTVIKTVVSGVLNQLKQSSALVDYSDIQVRQLSVEPTTMEVRFSYKPAFPINYVDIVFSLDLTTGDVTTTVAGV